MAKMDGKILLEKQYPEADEIIDECCTPSEEMRVNFTDITRAAYKIRKSVIRTPCSKSKMDELAEWDVHFKKEILQVTGSFKERGSCYSLMMLSNEERSKGVICASLGNHSQSLSYHGRMLHIPVTVVMPIGASNMKVKACVDYGAKVICEGKNMKEATEFALSYAKKNCLKYINGFDNPHIIAGQGTIGLEIIEDVPDAEAVIIPIGGGGLLAGTALAIKTLNPQIRIIGIESERCASFFEAMAKGHPVEIESQPTLADGLAVQKVGNNAFQIAAPLIDKLVVIKEEWIAVTILKFIEKEKCVVEGAGACGLAAILSGQLNDYKDKKMVVIVGGGNIDTSVLSKCIERGLAVDGRLLKFTVTISDRPGGISQLCQDVAQVGASIQDITHERAWVMEDVFSVNVAIVCETRDMDHVNEIKHNLVTKYPHIVFGEIPLLC